MELLFENKTKYTKATYKKFVAFHHKKYQFSYILYTVAVVAFILSGLIFQLKSHNFSLAVVLCCGLTFFILWRLFHPTHVISKEYKSTKVQQEKEYTFKFYSNYFTVEDKKEIFEIKYGKLYRVFETPDFFYLYLAKKQAFLVDKSKFKEHNPKAFSAFIKKKNHWWNRLLHAMSSTIS